LLRILERIERPTDEEHISSPRQLIEPRDEGGLQLANSNAANQANRLVERIASAMLKLRVQGG
jgi:hypothetical protein